MNKEIEEWFQKTSEILFGERLTGLQDYETWLSTNVEPTLETVSTISKKPIYVPPVLYYKEILNNLVTIEESLELGENNISEQEVEQLNLSNASELLKEIKTISSDVVFGKNTGIEICAAYIDSHYCFKSSFVGRDKYVAYCFWPRQSEYVFGSELLFSSKFCINCYYSSNLTRCFELDNCDKCTDCYFCHNCENLDNCMFCFNTKAKRYAIGNVEVGKEEYFRIKKLLLNDIHKKLHEKKRFDKNIYDL